MTSILYEDENVIALMKSAGVLAEKTGRKSPLEEEIKEYLYKKRRRPKNSFLKIVNPLDRAISGVVLFAKTRKSFLDLARQFSEGNPEKAYRAILVGKLRDKKGILRSKIKREKSGYIRAVMEESFEGGVDYKGKRTALEYRVIKEGLLNSLVEVKSEAGKFREIRAQLGAIGHPILGDVKYGSPTILENGCVAFHSGKIIFLAHEGERKIELSVSFPDYFKELL